MSVFRKVKKYWVLIAVVILAVLAFAVWDERIKTAEGSVPVNEYLTLKAARGVEVEYVRTIDGDTVVFRNKAWAPFQTYSVRVNGIDTPEKQYKVRCTLEKERAYVVSNFVQRTLEVAERFELRNITLGSHSRMEADVYFYNKGDINGTSLTSILLAKKFNPNDTDSVHYARVSIEGEKKSDWCTLKQKRPEIK